MMETNDPLPGKKQRHELSLNDFVLALASYKRLVYELYYPVHSFPEEKKMVTSDVPNELGLQPPIGAECQIGM